MVERDENGRFVKGHNGGPGRPKKEREEKYLDITMTACTFDDWKAIIKKAVDQAKRGDATARKWLGDYLVGAPTQRHELSGKDGGAIKLYSIVSPDDWPENGQ